MVNKRILVVGTYPIKLAQHGGQKRLEAIVAAYQKTFAQVRYVAVFYKGFYKDYTTYDIPLGPSGEAEVQRSPFTGDIVSGEAIYSDPVVKKRMTAHLAELQPDIIHIEQPYAYLGLKKLLKELDLHPKLVFGSQNIEAPMKREILEGNGSTPDFTKTAVKIIDDIESELARSADLVAAVTPHDCDVHKTQGAKRIVLAQNGIAPIHSSSEAVRYWQERFAREHVTKTALFVGSAHPPNWAGFQTMVSLGVGFVPFNARLLLAGSISDYFDSTIVDRSNMYHVTFWQRVISCGRLSDDRLSALLKVADVIMLPITEGGGSNLKTAEALIADKPIVATSHAFRSYEEFRSFPNVYIADKPDDFRAAILTAFSSHKKPRSPAQQDKVKAVLWESRLQQLVSEVKSL